MLKCLTTCDLKSLLNKDFLSVKSTALSMKFCTSYESSFLYRKDISHFMEERAIHNSIDIQANIATIQ
ncbi:hypothetical protein Y032_0002g973 [Ancylostoma ceylanicum]|uniref:Uncharacterized protein n=1 Tax=Ancylostoma ceylanicum TaxID=53326 RepID=A0A016W1M7_9BILA|nr:hypothetical protein Y032_0002g973 [Ancylostoma ceylanicum]